MTLGILITYYNEGQFLTECLESLLAQTASVDEIVIYDDASAQPAAAFVPAHVPVKIVRGQVNRGPACGRNALLRQCKSDWIHFHDSDDLFEPNWSADVRRALAAPAVDAVFSEVSFQPANGGAVSSALRAEGVIGLEAVANGEDLVRFSIRGSLLTPSGTYRRTAVEAVGGYREDVWQSEDWDFHVRLTASGLRYQIVSEPLVRCRARAEGRSQKRVEVATSAVRAIERLAEELPSKYRHDLSEKAAQLGSTLFRLNAVDEARLAFQLATRLGPPTFERERPAYRAIGRCFGAEAAERVGHFYRRILPETFRRQLSD